MTESLSLAVWVPVVVGLVMSVILVERVIEVSIYPGELWHVSKEVGHLSVVVGLVVVAGTDGVECLVYVRVNDLVAEIVVALLPEVLWEVRRIEVYCCHI